MSPLWQSVNKFLLSLKCCRNWGMRLARFTLFCWGAAGSNASMFVHVENSLAGKSPKLCSSCGKPDSTNEGNEVTPQSPLLAGQFLASKGCIQRSSQPCAIWQPFSYFQAWVGSNGQVSQFHLQPSYLKKKGKWPFWTPLGPKAPHLESLVPYNSILWLHFCWQPYWHRCGVQKWKVIHLPSSPSIFSLQPKFPASFGMTAKKPRFWVCTGEFTEDRNFHGCVFIHNGVKTPFYKIFGPGEAWKTWPWRCQHLLLAWHDQL